MIVALAARFEVDSDGPVDAAFNRCNGAARGFYRVMTSLRFHMNGRCSGRVA
ncbi:hypothetical protein [Lysobacter sp. HA35]